jgi:hypothetical protein
MRICLEELTDYEVFDRLLEFGDSSFSVIAD